MKEEKNEVLKNNAEEWQDCPRYVVALLDYLDNELCRMMWNKEQRVYESPFSNSGNRYENNVFTVEAYSWNDETSQEYNFYYKPGNIKIRWYKYLGRDTEINILYPPKYMVNMFDHCMVELENIEKEFLEALEAEEE